MTEFIAGIVGIAIGRFLPSICREVDNFCRFYAGQLKNHKTWGGE